MYVNFERDDRISALYREGRYYLKNWFLQLLINEEEEGIGFFDIPDNRNKFAVLLVKTIAEHKKLFNVFKRIISLIDIKLIPFFDENLLTYIIVFDEHCSAREAEERMFSLAEEVKSMIDDVYENDYTIGLGIIVSEISGILSSYEGAAEALEYNIYLGERQIIYIKDMRAGFSEASTEYVNVIKLGEEELLRKVVDDSFQKMRQHGLDLDSQKRCCIEMIFGASRALYEVGRDSKVLFLQKNIRASVNKCKSSDELYKLMCDINRIIITRVSVMRKIRNEKIIEKVKSILAENYAGDASLQSVASQVYLSPSYLSVVFSKEMNMTFKDYLMQIRINKAKELLETTDLKIYEVAESVGYTDARYFSDIFRRYTGINPTQYKNEKTGR